jgi:superfamily II DNA or RNA helicase/HKD family nuclease/SOS-response transcriptional repressor LexA
MGSLLRAFNESLQTGFVDKTILSDVLYQPELLVNNKFPRKKVLSSIIEELEKCEEFLISVAFVTTSGVATLINTFKNLEDKGVKGKILVSQYLNFTQPEALRRLLRFKNIDLRIATDSNFHSKGYIFKTSEYYNLIIGSSNLTASALATNKEWNLKVSALNTSGVVEKVLREFDSDFSEAIVVNELFISSYEDIYKKQFIFPNISEERNVLGAVIDVKPNSMQVEALENLRNLRANSKRKALLISATGTGKTYLSAFDAKAFNSKKLLFVVHRLNIAKKSLETFKTIFRSSKTYGVYSGNRRELDNDFVFSTVQTISKQSHLELIAKDHFDYIVIDESHRSGAVSYKRLIDHFEPDFLLGMTATPERTDGNDIFSLFDHNIAYEIRLNRAMEEDMLSQFHYYGVSDLSINGELVEDITDFNLLTSDERVKKILSNAEFYGSDNGIIRGLVFCSKKKEANELSRKFNERGYNTIALTGDNSEEERLNAIIRLESDDLEEKLDYIFTVDIFNEGVDIPKINQILMIRPTNSAIIFIQQLGRGLRKVEGKGYLTVIDFIGNYKNNYLIPIALYGDTSYNKDTLRKMISEGSRTIPGASTINFDRITKEQIFKSIDTANMQMLTDLKKDFNLLKYKIGRIPTMMDFIEHGSRDPFLYVQYSKSFFNFIRRVEKDFSSDLSYIHSKLLELFSKEINNSKRIEESIILEKLLEDGPFSVKELKKIIFTKYSYNVSDETIESAINNLNFEFVRENKSNKLKTVREIYDLNIVEIRNGEFNLMFDFVELLKNNDFRLYLLDSTKYSIFTFDKYFDIDLWHNGFILYRKYSRKDVFRILNVKENPVAQNVGGYMVTPGGKHCPIFVNYHKEDNISESTKYEDEFVNNREFNYMSKSNRKLESKDVRSILGKSGDIRLPMFIKKSNDEGTDFYFISDVEPELDKTEQTFMNTDSGKKISVVRIRFNLHSPVSESMYHYLRENIVFEKNKRVSKNDKKEKSKELEFVNHNKQESKNVAIVPLYDFYAAAGSFSEMQFEKDFSLIEVPVKYKNDEYFACKVVGESMNKIIPNGSICLFKKYQGGTRNGKIVLIEYSDYQDPDFNSAFTVKTYSSKKIITDDGWYHSSIVLRPNSYDNNYENIIIDDENSIGMRVVGEFVKVLHTL